MTDQFAEGFPFPLKDLALPLPPEEAVSVVLAALQGKRALTGIHEEIHALRDQVARLKDGDRDAMREILAQQAVITQAAAARYLFDGSTARDYRARETLTRIGLAAQRTLTGILGAHAALEVKAMELRQWRKALAQPEAKPRSPRTDGFTGRIPEKQTLCWA